MAQLCRTRETAVLRRPTLNLLIFLMLVSRPWVAVAGDHWHTRETSSFRIWTKISDAQAARSAEACESIRQQLCEQWLGKTTAAWTPKCEIVLHATEADYAREIGADSSGSSGCSTITMDGGRVIFRRIDVCAADPVKLNEVLPHEMTHVFLADRFPNRQPARWIDEGMAVLAEPTQKRKRRLDPLLGPAARERFFEVATLVAMERYPHPSRREEFYGQSVSLVHFLVERQSPADFMRFVELSMSNGYDHALATVYQIRDVDELALLWNQQSGRGLTLAAAFPFVDAEVRGLE